jgi:hypothetical protein
VAEFGAAIGSPAREVMVDVPPRLFEVVDRVYQEGKPLATWVEVAGERRRLTVSPRRDPENDEIYGVAVRLARS